MRGLLLFGAPGMALFPATSRVCIISSLVLSDIGYARLGVAANGTVCTVVWEDGGSKSAS